MEIRIALESVANLLRSHASQILSGAVPAGLPKPAAPPAPTVTPPATTKIFSTKPLCWRDKENPAFTRRHPAFAQADLLPELADRAVALGAALPIDHPQVRVLSRGNPPKHSPGLNSSKQHPLFDHLVGQREQLRWNFESECLGGLEVDNEFEFC
jgi:hypothetical protein